MGLIFGPKKIASVLFERLKPFPNMRASIRVQWLIEADATVDELKVIHRGLSHLVRNVEGILQNHGVQIEQPASSGDPDRSETYPSSVPTHREGYG